MHDINTALIALLGVLCGAYINNFAAEDFRRFRDGQALAGALAGELASIQASLPDLLTALKRMSERARDRECLDLQEMPQSASPIFEANAQKIGLLVPEVAREVAFVYERVRAFRSLFHYLSKYHGDMQFERRKSIIQGIVQMVDGGEERIDALVKSLDEHAKKKWVLPIIVRRSLWGAMVVAIVWAGFSVLPHIWCRAGQWIANP